ncbi:MAG: SDR family NAD(P)-dependent oxidoreductase [Thermoplasmatales archaeon]|nr:SDR family NAD(P)-dependent oxidoreductase [Thermoplasmatales archaeon]
MKTKDELVLVTGGAGFIGSHLVNKLVSKGYQVRVLDILSRGTLDYIQPMIDKGKVEYIDGDIRYKDAIDKAMKGVDYVFHEAATNINRSMAYPEESFDVNFTGAHVVFKSALDHKVKKVMFASSASVYGQPKVLPMSEEGGLNPITPYCVSKLASEYLLKFYSRFGLKHVIFRYFNVYGLHQHTDAYYTSVIILFLKRLLNNEPPIISGTGEQSMDFVNVKDVVRANIMGMESSTENVIFNVGTGVSTSIKDLAYMLIKFADKKVEPIFNKKGIELVSERRADIKKAKELIGFKAEIDIKKGLKEVAEDIMKHPERY